MPCVQPRALLAFAAALVATVAPAPAAAGELQLDGRAHLKASTWRGDYAGGGQIRFGYRFVKIIAVDLAIWEELASVATPLNTGLTAGVTAAIPLDGVRPTLRVYAIHQHEEPLISVAEAPLGVVFGLGDGIRHRAGGGAALGLEIPFHKRGDLELVALPTLSATLFSEDALGPRAYFGVAGGIGFNYGVAGLP